MGIQKRLVGSYFIVIVLTVLILEVFLNIFVRYYYYHNIEQSLKNQAELSASFFQQYFTEEDLEKQAATLLKGFANHSDAQVQIISATGQLLQDSEGVQQQQISMSSYMDVQAAMRGQMGIWRGENPTTKEPILAVSFPLESNQSMVGQVRFITSLTETMYAIYQITWILIGAGLFVILIVTVLGLFISSTITKSIKDLKLAADQMMLGDFDVRVRKRYQDELGSLADTLNMMAHRISVNEQLKNDFIASVSHELRTPLTSIKGWVITLQASRGNNQSLLNEGLHIIEAEGDRLTHMVDELLDFSKLDNGRISLVATAINLSELLQQVSRQLAPRANRQEIGLELKIKQTLPIIQADENRLKQVMINLIDNAIKFTHGAGRIVISAYTIPGKVVITVEDTGIGIEEQELNCVLQKFYKGKTQSAGSGLGLSISNQIINLHQGQLEITSKVGKGTIVKIELPI